MSDQESEIESSRICSFYHLFKELVEINLETSEKTSRKLSFPLSRFRECISICPLPENKLFCFGVIASWAYLSGLTFIVNENYDVQILPKGRPSTSRFATYYKDCVYIFGL